MPLAASAITSRRSSGDASSPRTSGTRRRVQHAAGPGSSKSPCDEAPVERGVVGDRLGPELRQRDPAGPGGAGGGSGSPRPSGSSSASVRRRQVLSRIRASPLSSSSSVASSCSTLRPGRSVLDLDHAMWARAGPGGGCRRRAGRCGRASTARGVLDGAREQRGGRPGVLEAPVPRAAGEAGGDEAVVIGLVQAIGKVHTDSQAIRGIVARAPGYPSLAYGDRRDPLLRPRLPVGVLRLAGASRCCTGATATSSAGGWSPSA